MTVHLPLPKTGKRQRRAHQKSRCGCGNCKLRRVKCDETYPACKRCKSYGVSCNYESTSESDDLQLSTIGAFIIETGRGSSVSLNQSMLNMINTPPSIRSPGTKSADSFFKLHEEDLRIISRFQSRTVLSVGTKESVHIYQKEWFRLACENQMLMHIVLALTLMHDRFLLGFADTPQGVTEAYHWYQGTAMFNRKLSGPIESFEKDALWGAAALLGVMSFANINATTYEEAWPLKATSDSDLDWL